jgi:hypothetical protein
LASVAASQRSNSIKCAVAQDVGLFAEAASPTAMGLVRFSGFAVTP